MSSAQPIKATHAAIRAYHAALQAYAEHGAAHEGATETAFSRLLADTARAVGWTLIPKQAFKVGGKTVYPDGTLRDIYNLPRGYWEAKDTDDDLATEIKKKIAKKYPLTNTVFEDTRTAVLYQHNVRRDEFDLTEPQQVADLLNQFYAFAEPDIEGFEQAVEEFKERVPELAQGLNEKIKEAHARNRKFQDAFDGFFSLCQTALNPNIRRDAVDEMLVQHLLTERLFRKIFHDDEFTRRNVIAAEVETVIDALVSKSFSRDEFLKSLDKFYRAIEAAAETIEAFEDKQHFLNTVYERFFQGYSVKVADTHGIVYTPQPIVDFMCASVEEVLKEEFGLTLGSPEVTVLDPCTGTGNFVVNLLRRVPATDLERMYKERLFANEVMLLPYYIAALNIEHAYYERTGTYEPFEGLCFVDTLDMGEQRTGHRQGVMFTEANTERVERQKRSPITVVIGNPPYNAHQLDENDKSRNREYKLVEQRIKQTYIKDSTATLRAQLYDPYVKFFRWATDRLRPEGIVCFVTNNSFVDQIAFDGMRKHLLQDFTRVYHLHLEGNVRQNPTLSGTQYNVFGVQVGVGITIAVKSRNHEDRRVYFHRIDKTLRRAAKLQWLVRHESMDRVSWEHLAPDERNIWLVSEHGDEFAGMTPIGSKEAKAAGVTAEAVFKSYCRGVVTNADAYVYDSHRERLKERAERIVDDFNAQLDRWRRKGKPDNLDEFLAIDEKVHKWIRKTKKVLLRDKHLTFDESNLRLAQYRPFSRMWYFFDRNFSEDVYGFPTFLPLEANEQENQLIAVTDIGSEKPFMLFAARNICDLHLVGAGSSCQCFPFYVYDEDGSNRRENVTDWALKQFRDRYKSKKITKWDIFHYVYGLLHHPGYRTKFADNLKRDLPRIPFAPDFKAFADAGRKLADLHVNYETVKPYPLKLVVTPEEPLSYVVTDRMRLGKDKTDLRVNDSLTLTGIPPKVFDYRLGNRSALEWVIDQYRVTEDARSGIVSDPNRPDDEQYIVRLVQQVVRVSLDTSQIVAGLPPEYSSD
ncbi:MAG: N-6 DNA methylase [Zavarzinella sp.]|nr:N-6 DNA methylase [Zavarzinella sp.]